ncbi:MULTISPECIES: trypsin-like peptidase domain-containing protein [Streptomyces]|uniref:Peptidase S1 n=3 Tax=Streptomyces TaxID=1883 RepID=A0A3S9PLF0_STRLT|nr:trypsin-like peptidase domain-containing protein [Streptomyces luteoverticillatus]AZQ73220.1 peptidase S1 [Streptomyces luteoverticillatus]
MLRALRALGLAVLTAGLTLTAVPAATAATPAAGSAAAPAAERPLTPIGGGTGIIFRITPTPEERQSFYVCTLTAVGRDNAGNLVGLTNAHCFIDEKGNKLVGEKVYRDTSPAGTAAAPADLNASRADLETGAIGEVTFVSTPNNLLNAGPKGLDYAVIKLDESRVAPTATVGGVTISSIGAPPPNGVRMCKQGHRTGLTCGIKLGTHDIWFTHLIWTNGGDSGSPVVSGQTLVGNAWGVQHSSAILDIIAEMNANGGVGAGFHLAV